MDRGPRQRRRRLGPAPNPKRGNGFSLLELVVVISVLAIIGFITMPMLFQFIKYATYTASKQVLYGARKECLISTGIYQLLEMNGVTFSTSNPQDTCNSVVTAAFDDGCSISLNLSTGEKRSAGREGWPNTYEGCNRQSLLAMNPKPIEPEDPIEPEEISADQTEELDDPSIAESIGEGQAEPTENPVNASFEGWEGSYTEARIEVMHYLDVDGDGVSEIISIGRTGTFLHFNNGEDWVSKRIAQGIDRAQINLGDIDGDGDQDIMFAGYRGGGGIGYFENTGDIALDEDDINLPTRYISSGLQSGPTDIEVADINGDGKQDLIVTASNDNSVYIYQNGSPDNYNGANPVPGWEPIKLKQEETRVGMYRSQAADIDGDGDLEILAAGDDLWF